MWDWSLDGWIIVVGILSACSCALVGNYLVLRKMSLMGDAISHAVLPGLAAAFLLSQSRSSLAMFVGAVIVGLLTALLTQMISRYGKVEEGASMGVVFSILFAIGLILIRLAADHVDLDPNCVLYGNIVLTYLDTTTVAGYEVPRAAVFLAITLFANAAFVLLFYKELKISSFDPELATALGYRANWLHYGLMMMVAITTVANFESVGSILVIAMLIVPSASAYLLTDSLARMMWLSLAFAVTSAVFGHLLAIWGPGWFGVEDSANTAAMMASVAGGLLAVVLIVSPRFGLIGRLVNQWRLRLQIAREDILALLYRWQEISPDKGEAITQTQLYEALGKTFATRLGIWSLARNKQIVLHPRGTMTLAAAGTEAGQRLVRSHRLWESFLAEHFQLPLDHLHQPAERMEHFIGQSMREELKEDLTLPSHDPHGREIPAQDDSRT